ncbi:MAG: radical SAM protein, partial [Clostridia bacterium]|nr:radical SAM protein [Clostridia bacterium]
SVGETMGQTFKIARVGLHHFEEPCISGDRGSGTIFFSGCTMKCLFCQNHQISHGGIGREITPDELLKCMKHLETIGAENINLVTPPANVNLLVEVLREARKDLAIPIVWNSNGYETVKNLKKLEGLVDIFLPDFKYSDNSLAKEYSCAPNYFQVAKDAISEMRRQQPIDQFDENGMMKKGVIVRHLVLPSCTENTKSVFDTIAKIDKNMFVSVMGQYFPTENVQNHPVLSRKLTKVEYETCTDSFFEAGLANGFAQDLDSATEEYVPDFNLDLLKEILG